jgi:hypothetical protein
MVGHVRSWSVMSGQGRSFPVMADHGRSCPVMADNGRSCPVMADHGRSCPVMAGHVRSWQVISGHAQSCPDMTGHVRTFPMPIKAQILEAYQVQYWNSDYPSQNPFSCTTHKWLSRPKSFWNAAYQGQILIITTHIHFMAQFPGIAVHTLLVLCQSRPKP